MLRWSLSLFLSLSHIHRHLSHAHTHKYTQTLTHHSTGHRHFVRPLLRCDSRHALRKILIRAPIFLGIFRCSFSTVYSSSYWRVHFMAQFCPSFLHSKKEAIKVKIKVIIQSLKREIFGVIGYSWNFRREIHWNCSSFTSKKVLKSANIFLERGWYNIVHSFSFDPLFLNSSVASLKVPFTWIRLNEWITKNYSVRCVTGGMISTEIRLDAR